MESLQCATKSSVIYRRRPQLLTFCDLLQTPTAPDLLSESMQHMTLLSGRQPDACAVMVTIRAHSAWPQMCRAPQLLRGKAKWLRLLLAEARRQSAVTTAMLPLSA